MEASFSFLLDLQARAFCLLFIALGLRWAIRQSSAKVRHRVAVAGTLMLLLLVLLLLVPPPVTVAPANPSPMPVEMPSTASVALSEAVSQSEPTRPTRDFTGFLATGLALISLIATAVAAVRLGIGVIQIRWCLSQCRPVDEPRTLILLKEIKHLLGVSSKITLRIASDTSVRAPLTVGWRHACVVLPSSAGDWSEDQLKMALCHEIAHIKRHDWLWLVIGEVARVAFAIQPMIWLWLRDLRQLGESATDELALSCGISRTEYAAFLVTLARDLAPKPDSSSLVLPMATESGFTERIEKILNEERKAQMIRPISLIGIVATALIAFCSLVTVARQPAFAQATDNPGVPEIPVGTTKDREIKTQGIRELLSRITSLEQQFKETRIMVITTEQVLKEHRFRLAQAKSAIAEASQLSSKRDAKKQSQLASLQEKRERALSLQVMKDLELRIHSMQADWYRLAMTQEQVTQNLREAKTELALIQANKNREYFSGKEEEIKQRRIDLEATLHRLRQQLAEDLRPSGTPLSEADQKILQRQADELRAALETIQKRIDMIRKAEALAARMAKENKPN